MSPSHTYTYKTLKLALNITRSNLPGCDILETRHIAARMHAYKFPLFLSQLSSIKDYLQVTRPRPALSHAQIHLRSSYQHVYVLISLILSSPRLIGRNSVDELQHLPTGTRVAVLVFQGSFCPITVGHIQTVVVRTGRWCES